MFGFLYESFDFFGRQSSFVVSDGDFIGLGGGLVSGSDVQNTVLVNIERNFDLGYSSGGGGDAFQVELTQQVVVLGKGSFSFEDLNEHSGLVVSVRGEDLRLFGRNGGVSGNQNSHDLSCSLYSQTQRSHIQQKHVLDSF